MLEEGSKPASGLFTFAVKYAERSATGRLFRVDVGMKFSPRLTGSRLVMFPEYEASTSHPPRSSRWKPSEYCCEYGSGRARNCAEMFWPTFVAKPRLLPIGWRSPVGKSVDGKGSFRLTAGVTPPSVEAMRLVGWLNP